MFVIDPVQLDLFEIGLLKLNTNKPFGKRHRMSDSIEKAN